MRLHGVYLVHFGLPIVSLKVGFKARTSLAENKVTAQLEYFEREGEGSAYSQRYLDGGKLMEESRHDQ